MKNTSIFVVVVFLHGISMTAKIHCLRKRKKKEKNTNTHKIILLSLYRTTHRPKKAKNQKGTKKDNDIVEGYRGV